MNHQYLTSTDCKCNQRPGCWLCDGGLAICKVCGLYEGSLTTECPGYECYKEKADKVYAGEIDFRNGEWVEGYTIHMAHKYGNPVPTHIIEVSPN